MHLKILMNLIINSDSVLICFMSLEEINVI